MTAVSLFDTLAGPLGDPARRSALAAKLVDSALADLDRVREYERVSAPIAGGVPEELSVQTSIHALYAEWADEAEQVAARARSLHAAPGTLADAVGRLEDAIGRVRARLSVGPPQLIEARKQADEGQFIPARELRDELRTRLRA